MQISAFLFSFSVSFCSCENFIQMYFDTGDLCVKRLCLMFIMLSARVEKFN